MQSDYSIQTLTGEQISHIECLYEGRDIRRTNSGLDYFGNLNSLEEILAKELDDLLKSYDDETTTTLFEPIESISSFDSIQKVNRVMDGLKRRVLANAKLAEKMETEIYSNINSYEFDWMGIQIKPCIDVLCLYFEPKKATNRSLIKQFITRQTSHRYYIRNDDSGISKAGTGFIIHLHNINKKKDLYKIIKILSKHYEASISSMKINSIELAVDFIKTPHIGLITALFKSLILKQGIIQLNKQGKPDFRIFKYSQGPIPLSPHSLFNRLKNGWNIAINHRDNDSIYYHFYYKTTDNNGIPLPREKWCIRVEVRLKEVILSSIGNDLVNFNHLLRQGFKYLRFTQLRSDVSHEDKLIYSNKVKPFGMEVESHYDQSRNKTNRNNIAEKNANLNTEISKCSSNFARFNLKMYS
ncbi:MULTISPECIES: hypothetical protein [Acinetobacter]|uniref:Uncharacterized protein n=2 Tax=Acinetobacter TaxID=469 RepID=N9DKJ7_9GAMM|nr:MULTISPECIES: hypothetical protein [Acinetobacter]ENV80983.1 hypothetical protein F942_00134 [Acinetobacter ursingii ANC 3649]MDI3239221.1 hypothetical protein [Acinetobacter ursingii]PZT87556.1 MAG: hypothetical protein DI627_06915 [Acinetobacter sp.]QXZ22394.1 hypothetical protein I6L31_11695 [Acinetobacter septicus]